MNGMWLIEARTTTGKRQVWSVPGYILSRHLDAVGELPNRLHAAVCDWAQREVPNFEAARVLSPAGQCVIS